MGVFRIEMFECSSLEINNAINSVIEDLKSQLTNYKISVNSVSGPIWKISIECITFEITIKDVLEKSKETRSIKNAIKSLIKDKLVQLTD